MVLVGASLGGAVALDFALHRPERLARLVLMDAQVGWAGWRVGGAVCVGGCVGGGGGGSGGAGLC